MDKLTDRFLAGDIRALARLITLIENNSDESFEYLDIIYERIGNARRIGVTGPPGAGKSTLVDQLTKCYRSQKKTVGIIAIDPTSPFTGGALLGDRIRMGDSSTDQGVFIRSMATRGSLGGLSGRAQEVADLMDGFGFDIVIMETVGVGQSELDIVESADSTIVTLVPESGDSIQAMKAGLMEIADIFVLNKSDRQGADRFQLELESILNVDDNNNRWKPPIVKTVANSGVGIEELQQSLEDHFLYQIKNQLLIVKRKKRIEKYIRKIVKERLLNQFWTEDRTIKLQQEIDRIIDNDISPYRVSEKLLKKFLNG